MNKPMNQMRHRKEEEIIISAPKNPIDIHTHWQTFGGGG